MVEPLRHRQTKEAATDMFCLKPPRHISTLPFATDAFRAIIEQCPLCAESDRQPFRDRLTRCANSDGQQNVKS
jgi:hypothetical protein